MGVRKPKTEWIEQIIPVHMDTNDDHFVVMKNELILGEGKSRGKNVSGLSLNAIKLLRLTIMQCAKSDIGFKPYKISVKELSQLLKIDSSNLYKDIQDICVNLLGEIVLVGDGNPKHKWKAFQWVTKCEYDGNGVITIQLHNDMKPYILGLKSNYTQYEINGILDLKSTYAIRMYELIKMELKNFKVYADRKKTIYLSSETIRKATGTTNKYRKANDLKKRVIDIACNEINKQPFGIRVTYDYVKESRTIVGYNFTVKTSLADVVLPPDKQAKLDAYLENRSI